MDSSRKKGLHLCSGGSMCPQLEIKDCLQSTRIYLVPAMSKLKEWEKDKEELFENSLCWMNEERHIAGL